MVQRSKQREEPEIPRSVDPRTGIQLLKKQIAKAEELLAK
ncbi:hypothetical protein MTYM_01850 [Methylococcales bacterium]|nr:hypothetical protein MTYM_01850 [Methylococcales bacterium]